jgi:hypothetical protein
MGHAKCGHEVLRNSGEASMDECSAFYMGPHMQKVLIRKLNARLCARGDNKMEGIDLFETFTPVCNWQTVRVMLLISLIYDFASL